MAPPDPIRGPIQNLDERCAVCQRLAGDHTLRELSTCMGTVTTDLLYEPIPADARRIAERSGLPDGTLVVDNVIAKSLLARADAGPFGQGLLIPLVLHEFSRSPDVSDVLARVAYMGDVDAIRQYGRLLRDTANGAANAAERGATL